MVIQRALLHVGHYFAEPGSGQSDYGIPCTVVKMQLIGVGNTEAVDALDALYTELGRWDDLTNLLERRLEHGVTAGVAIDLRFRLAEIQRLQLANRTRALEYLGIVLEGEPDHAKAIEILQEMLSDPEVCVEVANLLEPVYIRRSAWKDLVSIDSLRLKFSEDPSLRMAWTQRIAQVYEEQIEDLDEAFNWYGRVFQEKPTDTAAQEQLLRLAPKQNRWRDLGRLLDDYLDNELGNTDEVLNLVRIAIRVYDQELGDHDNARRHYRRYLEALPGDRAASRLFEDALERWEAWGELRDLLDDQARIVESAKEKVDHIKLRLPLVGEIWLKYQVAQLARILSTLLVGGIPLVQAMETAADSLGTPLLQRAVEAAGKSVREGQPLSGSLKQSKIFPPLAIDMIEVGESTGALPAMLNSVAEFFEEDVNTKMAASLSLIEPAIMIVMGGFVAFVLIALYLPIFSLADTIR